MYELWPCHNKGLQCLCHGDMWNGSNRSATNKNCETNSLAVHTEL